MTATITCADLYRSDPTFRSLIDLWGAGRRCPLVTVDLLLEYGLEAAADCCRWAATEPERPVFWTTFTEFGPPYPTTTINDKSVYVWCLRQRTGLNFADDIPVGNVPDAARTDKTRCRSAVEAILWLLDNWQPKESL